MEREIKFRCWDKFQKKYVFTGFHICGEVTAFCGMDMVIHETWKERSEKLGYKTILEAWNDFEFEEFTGFQDTKGVDIYENDVVEHKRLLSQPNKIKSLVKFEKGCFVLILNKVGEIILNSYILNYDIEVIGNIHNTELKENE